MALISVGEGSGPWLPKARKVEMTKVPQVQRKTVRIAAPACFRAPWLGASTKDIPTQVIQTLVGLTQVSASEFCGGRWTEQEKPKAGCQLVTFLHLKDSLVDTLVQKSGEQGIFCTEIKKQPGEMQTFCVQRETQESYETYHRRVIALKKERKQPVIFRFGLVCSLGTPNLGKPEDTLSTMSLEHGGKKRSVNS